MPRRELGKLSQLGWIGIGMGLISCLFMFSWMYMPISWGIEDLRQGNKSGWIPILFGMTGLFGLYFAAKMLSAGWSVLNNRSYCKIHIGDAAITNHEYLGWYRFKTKTSRQEVEAIRICPALSDPDVKGTGNRQVTFGSNLIPKELGAIFLGSNKSNRLATGYPVKILRELAELLRRELTAVGMNDIEVFDQFNATSSSIALQTSNQSVALSTAQDAFQEKRLGLPEESELEETELDGAAVYRVPSRGLLRGSHGLLPFAVLWNGFMLVFTTVALANMNLKGSEALFVIGLVALFWIAGIGLLVGAFYLGKQSAMLGVRDGSLFIERKTIFGTKWTEFEPNQIAAVEVGASGMEVNGVPVMQLHVFPHGKKRVGMLTQLGNEELDWLAQNLREQLGLRSDQQGWLLNRFDLDQELSPPASSQVVVDQSDSVTTIDVPAIGLWDWKSPIYFALLFTFASFPIAIALMFAFGFDPMVFLVPLVTTLTGAGILISTTIYRTRRFNVRATDQKLTIERRGYWSDFDFEVERKELLDVLVADSGVRTNNKIEMKLHIKCDSQPDFSMMYGRDEMEIGYVAALILQRMGRKSTGSEQV